MEQGRASPKLTAPQNVTNLFNFAFFAEYPCY